MHIPDGFLAAPVWLGLDALSLPALGWVARRAQREFEETRVPLLGVMGAFVFAAQMIQFPVGVGTSGHLVGGALLAIVLGPAAAAVVMAAILTVQALVFQDGGVLALGANAFNMALIGVLAGWLPYRMWGGGARRRTAIFTAGALSVLASAVLALAELLASGIAVPRALLGLSLALFAVTAALEGAITVAVVQGIEALNTAFVRKPTQEGSRALQALGVISALMAGIGVLLASTYPDGLQRLGERLGIAGRAHALIDAPLANYQARLFDSPWMQKASAGLLGLAAVYAVCVLLGRLASRQRSA